VPQVKSTTRLRGSLIENPLDVEVNKLIKEMLCLSPKERHDINQVHQQIKNLYNNGVPPKDGKNKLFINMKPKL
jgi:CRISPR/Cas system-associated exonuclease Cas4 (RecB family)